MFVMANYQIINIFYQRKKRVPAPSLPGSSSISTCHWQETVLRYCSHNWKLTCHPVPVSLQVSFICLQKPARSMCEAESAAHTEGVSIIKLPHPSESLPKQWLWKCKHVRGLIRKSGPHLDRQCLLLVGLVLVALCGMVLLLLWNYQCFIVTQVCQDQDNSFVHFATKEEGPSSHEQA
ncbi:hypothetical protein SRHO_G00265080 [Serrasalmus rhombeus]